MTPTRTSWVHLLVLLLVAALGGVLWQMHARAWDLGRRSPVLSFDAAQYAVAGRELAEHGRLATPFVLPIELARHPQPPWPLAVVQPGLVVAEAAIERLAPSEIRLGARRLVDLRTPAQREWLALLLPFVCFLTLGVLLAWIALELLTRVAPDVHPGQRGLGALAVAAAFLLDPEAQHFAVGGFTELPYTLGLVLALYLLATERASRNPFRFGLLLGLAGAFRGNMLWMAPVMSAAAAMLVPAAPPRPRVRVGSTAPARAGDAAPPAPRGFGRVGVFVRVMLGYAALLLPWWLYKWSAFGSPGWDLSSLAVWDGIGGWTWFTLTHLPQAPQVPHGAEAFGLILTKLVRNLRTLSLEMTLGPRGLWLGSLAVWLLVERARPALRVTGAVILAHALITMIVAALGASWLRYLFPARVPLEAAGVLALWALIGRAPPTMLGPSGQRVVRFAVAALALFWGNVQTIRGLREARATAGARALPAVATLVDLSARLARELPADTPVMSNLGPSLAWFAHRPVVHLALTPSDVDACRRRFDTRHLLLVFTGPERAWNGWSEIVARPEEATLHPDWNVVRERHWRSDDDFQIVWLELGPPRQQLAAASRSTLAASAAPLGASLPR